MQNLSVLQLLKLLSAAQNADTPPFSEQKTTPDQTDPPPSSQSTPPHEPPENRRETEGAPSPVENRQTEQTASTLREKTKNSLALEQFLKNHDSAVERAKKK